MDRLNRVDLSILDAVVENHTNAGVNIDQLGNPKIWILIIDIVGGA